MRAKRAFTLIELLVVVAIIGVLVAMLLPAIQAVKSASRRGSCQNNLRQLGIALRAYETANGHLPTGADSRPYPKSPGTPNSFYRWSTLAYLTPYIEEGAIFRLLNLKVPLYASNLKVAPENQTGVASVIPLLLCPADQGRPVADGYGPTNYVACTGTGSGGGTPFGTDGLFYVNSAVRLSAVTDGANKTVAFSESSLGTGDENLGDPAGVDPQTVYGFSLQTPLTEEMRDSTAQWNVQNRRGFSWANGEYRCTMYNHYLPPNDLKPDFIANRLTGSISERYSCYGWRGARSFHGGGVNVFFLGGATVFIADNIDLKTWQALATRSGNEIFDPVQ